MRPNTISESVGSVVPEGVPVMVGRHWAPIGQEVRPSTGRGGTTGVGQGRSRPRSNVAPRPTSPRRCLLHWTAPDPRQKRRPVDETIDRIRQACRRKQCHPPQRNDPSQDPQTASRLSRRRKPSSRRPNRGRPPLPNPLPVRRPRTTRRNYLQSHWSQPNHLRMQDQQQRKRPHLPKPSPNHRC